MARRLSRDVSPDKRVKLERGTPSFFDKNFISAALAFPSTGGVVKAILSRALYSPTTPSRLAPGCAWIAKTTASALVLNQTGLLSDILGIPRLRKI